MASLLFSSANRLQWPEPLIQRQRASNAPYEKKTEGVQHNSRGSVANISSTFFSLFPIGSWGSVQCRLWSDHMVVHSSFSFPFCPLSIYGHFNVTREDLKNYKINSTYQQSPLGDVNIHKHISSSSPVTNRTANDTLAALGIVLIN